MQTMKRAQFRVVLFTGKCLGKWSVVKWLLCEQVDKIFFLKTRDAKFIKYIYFKQGNIFQLPLVLETAVEKWLARLSVCLVVMYSTSKRVEIFAPTPTYIVLDPQIAT